MKSRVSYNRFKLREPSDREVQIFFVPAAGGAPAVDNLLLETGDNLLLESGDLLLLEA